MDPLVTESVGASCKLPTMILDSGIEWPIPWLCVVDLTLINDLRISQASKEGDKFFCEFRHRYGFFFEYLHDLDVDPVVPPFRLKKICLSHAIADVNLYQRIFFVSVPVFPSLQLAGSSQNIDQRAQRSRHCRTSC
ncbi:hypothetical protein CY34DRAFT_808811 [Suillus luteus UH-Slu-Lm8-n1]|uniref:Uncharacterized protein n=1 Tax=Suillus luteus UH-Slu-Lm8-n1 TaxID=930992 RepID=A0A0D0AB64_9AGAM|nr:hypothetical protein CY34DRAFT_808811 [Suillus luteus UH-Slu-Lm8-n1]